MDIYCLPRGSGDQQHRQASDNSPRLADTLREEFLSFFTFDEPIGGTEGTEEGMESNQELCGHRDEDTDEVHKLWGYYRLLMEENKQLREENATLLAEIRDVQRRVDDMSSALAGQSDAKDRVRHRVSLEERRNDLVKLVTYGHYLDWLSYQITINDASNPCSLCESLKSLAAAVIPELQARAQFPPSVQSEPGWKALPEHGSEEDKIGKEAMEAEYAMRVQEAREAQRALELLQDKELWDFIQQS